MIKVFGSKMCVDCKKCELNFNAYKIEHEFVDINESLKNLKQFLAYRDSNPAFDDAKKHNRIGIPACIDEDGRLFTDWESYVEGLGHKVLSDDGDSASCRIDGKGC